MDEPTQTITYTYDELDRLVGVSYPDGTSIRYTYDAAGNRTAMEIVAPPPPIQPTVLEERIVKHEAPPSPAEEIAPAPVPAPQPMVTQDTERKEGVGYAQTQPEFTAPLITWQLAIQEGLLAGTTFTLKDNNAIGRQPENDIIIEDLKISRRHALIQKQDDAFVLSDLGSANGTFLNGERLAAPAVIQEGDLIELGSTRLQVQVITTPKSG